VSAAPDIPARFALGARGRIDDRASLGHCRTPVYLRGHVGRVVGVQGTFRDPEVLAYNKPGYPARVLYKVAFLQRDLWPDYSGPPSDALEADIYEHWLQPADRPAAPGAKRR
jgi:nitrile hydratase